MKIRGIKRGQTIELLEQINSIPDGAEMVVDLELFSNERLEKEPQLLDEARLAKLNQLFGIWKYQPELTEIFTEIDQQRHCHNRAIALHPNYD
ncbi:hypothetical protein IQ276_022930 [Desmonostoc muscorum LEGE 12446]|uniref:Uncharacterized protein n=1 Tax=Desmonostoc muscorum LEGE 12446 TaxID=1828758 RepID=A0A8J7A2H2_DESMC|nr:hypothetical protein [Desmonostoc muscorum]MCF2149228.1 hypothetical protein [Desmonostoc muscorum LEGE 12446]